jgi:hypothetical protein
MTNRKEFDPLQAVVTRHLKPATKAICIEGFARIAA